MTRLLDKILAWWRGDVSPLSAKWLSDQQRVESQTPPIIAVWRSPREIAEMERQ